MHSETITLDTDLDWLGKFPEQFFREQDERRQEKAERHALAWKVMRGEPCELAGHFDVSLEHRYVEFLMRSGLSVWGGHIAAKNFPEDVRSVRVEPDDPESDKDCKVAQVVEAVFRDKCKDLMSDLIRYTVDSGAGFGLGIMVAADYKYDDELPGKQVCFHRRCLDFGEFVLDRGAPDWRLSPVGRRVRYSRAQLLEMSEPAFDEEGKKTREAVFDREQVERLFEMNKVGVYSPGGSEMEWVKGEVDGDTASADTPDWFDCFEFIGTVIREGKILGENQIITSCADICLRAGDDPDQAGSWVLFGSEDGQLGDPYPESKGYLVAMKEINTNLYGTWMAYSRSTEVFGMLTFDPDYADYVDKWGESFFHGPKKKIPKIFEQFQYRASNDTFEKIRMENRRQVLELIGVSDQAIGGMQVPNVSATAAAGHQAMAETRLSLDAKHYYPLFEQLLQIHYRLLLDNWDVEVATLDDGTRWLVTREDLGDFRGQLVLTSAGNVIPHLSRVQNWEKAKPALQQAVQQGMVAPDELLKAELEHYGIDRALIRRLVKPPPPPQAPQAPAMAGPPVDNVVPMPGMAVGA